MLADYGLICSMSRKGNGWDNSVAESFFHTVTELIYTQRYSAREIAKQSVFHYIETYYNRVRQHATLDLISRQQLEDQGKMLG
jgi:transposase InsO family protein